MSRSKGKIDVNTLVKASFLVGISVVLTRVLSIMVPLAGLPTLRIGFGSIPVMISGVLFGPLVGFLVGGIADVLGYLINPMGPYFPGITLAAALFGFIPGVFYHYMKIGKSKKKFSIINTAFIITFLASIAYLFYEENTITIANRGIYLNESKIPFFIIAIVLVVVIIFIVSPYYFGRKYQKYEEYSYDKINFIVTVTYVFCSLLLNTFFLSILYEKGFLIFLPGRILSGFFTIPLYSFVIYGISRKFEHIIK